MSATRAVRLLAARLPARLAAVAPDVAAVERDVSKWYERNHLGPEAFDRSVARLLVDYPEFRNLLYWRLRRGGGAARAATWAAARGWRPVPTLDIACREIGPGLTLAHGHGTILTAERIGRDCWIHHQVTIGWDYKTDRSPILGDDVFVGAGAKILGAITIGDGARIGANAVVVRDVPAGATAVGVPATVRLPGA